MTPGTCYKLDIFINEVLRGEDEKQRSKTTHELTQLALQGDCQFNCRCSQWEQCPMAKQTRPKPCSKFFTEPTKDNYNTRKNK